MRPFDVSPWNIGAVALAVATGGCTARALGSGDTNASDTEADVETTVTDDGLDAYTDDGLDGYTDDGLDGYTDIDGVDGHIDGYDDYSDYADGYIGNCQYYGCGVGAICEDFYGCRWLDQPAACPDPAAAPVRIPDADGALSITFADLDGNGRDELVATKGTAVAAVDFVAGTTNSTIAPGPTDPQDVVTAGVEIDTSPGREVLFGFDQLLNWHGTGGTASFGVGTAIMHPFTDVDGLAVSSDSSSTASGPRFLAWGRDGGVVVSQLGDAISSMYYADQIARGAAWVPSTAAFGFEDMFWVLLDQPAAPFVALRQLGVSGASTDLTTDERGRGLGIGRTAESNAAFATDRSADPTNFDAGWTAIHFYDHSAVSQVPRFYVDGVVVGFTTADVDGDGVRDVVYALDHTLFVLRLGDGLGGAGTCATEISVIGLGAQIEAIAAGDHDGDGDEELAVIVSVGNATAEVYVVDPD